MKRIITAIQLLFIAFVIPCILMSSWFALTQTKPPKITAPVLKDVMKLTPICHNLPTAYLNQHRLMIAGLPTAIVLAIISLFINPKRRQIIFATRIGSTILVAVAASRLDCSWLFRTHPEWIGEQTVIRSLPCIGIGFAALWILEWRRRSTGKAVDS